MSTNFKKTLAALNAAQTEAVQTIEGPVMVVAGPGTGKTHVLAARIANILKKTDTPPHAILALTFTESAAAHMRERVVGMIGKEGYYVQIMTFHAFCVDVIRTHPEYFPIERDSTTLSDLEKYDLFQSLIDDMQLDVLKPLNMPYFYIRDIIHTISQLKREGIMPDDYKKIVEEEFKKSVKKKLTKTKKTRLEKNRQKNLELIKIYTRYQKKLRSRMRYDFDDMIALVVDAFKKHKILLQEYQEKLHYFLVDEYQDTNTSQNTVVELLARYWGENANLFTVGDPNQSIYRFQGASIENTLNFVKKYPQAKIITLDTGYRSVQPILDAAHEVIEHNQLTQEESTKNLHKAVSKKLSSAVTKAKKSDKAISYIELPSQTLELVYIAEHIKDLMSKKIAPENIAILYRHNADAVELQRVLEKWNIPYEVEGGENILEAELINQLMQLMFVVHDVRRAEEDEKLFEIMSYPWTDIDAILAMKIAHAAGKAKMTIVELIGKGYEEFMKYYKRSDVTHVEFHIAEVFILQIQQWAVDDMHMPFTEWFEHFIKQSGYLDYILKQENKIELLTNLNSLYREVKTLVAQKKKLKLAEFISSIQTMQHHRIGIYAEDLNVQKGVVHLSTVHRAKGREWDHVFILHFIDGKWGNARHREMIPLPAGLLSNTDISKKERNEDERRLFYVALTRAKKTVTISSPQTMISVQTSKEVAPSMFSQEIDGLETVEPELSFDDTIENMTTMLQPSTSLTSRLSDKEYFTDVVKDFRLSVTALNTYLRDTDEFVQNVLLRVPRAKPAAMAFGSAVHYALEQLNKARAAISPYTRRQFIADFESALENEILSDEEFEKRRQHGITILTNYFKEYAHEDIKPLFVERFIGTGMRKAVLDDIYLSGRIDRVDLIDPKEKIVRIIDYKTGRPRTMGEIEGRTVSAQLSAREKSLPEGIRGAYKRQMLFYKLLTELDSTFSYTAVEGMFDFVEPHRSSGKCIRHIITYTEQDINNLKQLIKDVVKEIRNLDFM